MLVHQVLTLLNASYLLLISDLYESRALKYQEVGSEFLILVASTLMQ